MTAVYVIAAEGGPVKVGRAVKPEARLAQLRTGSPFPLRLAHVEDVGNLDAGRVERAAHVLLETARAHGEWFFVSVARAREAVQQAVEQVRNEGDDRPTIIQSYPDHIHHTQCRVARGLLDWTSQQLATASGIGIGTIVRFERGEGARTRTMSYLRFAFESAGIQFIPGDDRMGPGARFRDPLP